MCLQVSVPLVNIKALNGVVSHGEEKDIRAE
jgi:hypothetical protein